MEMGPDYAAAVPASEALEKAARGSGHLLHMPGHIYMQLGWWVRAAEVNQRAVDLDNAWAAQTEGSGTKFYRGYTAHNLHFIVYCAMQSARFEEAMDAARRSDALYPVLAPGFDLNFLEHYTWQDIHVLLRFGKWEEVLARPFREGRPGDTALLHYARTVALAALGRIPEAAEEAALLSTARTAVPEVARMHNVLVHDMLDVAELVAEGEMEYRKGSYDRAFELLRRAVQLEQDLPYDEPPGVMMPVRHALGALLLAQGHVEEATAVFQEDLVNRFSFESVWALRGLLSCFEASGDEAAAADVRARLDKAQAGSDVTVGVACMCARASSGAS
mmetsp:Transcript_14463/g.48927  ORF Transcript_14463/g.48927 Transcript_14463/m.48927 type:complete len:332 (+) Transcript_14463:164-1159(+)